MTDINFDYKSTPLQIRSNSKIGSSDLIWTQFVDSSGNGRGISITLGYTPSYEIGYCTDETVIPKELLGTDDNRVWTLKEENSKLELTCNGVQIFEFDFAGPGVRESCKNKWSLGATILKFASYSSGTDNASDFYRRYTSGMN